MYKFVLAGLMTFLILILVLVMFLLNLFGGLLLQKLRKSEKGYMFPIEIGISLISHLFHNPYKNNISYNRIIIALRILYPLIILLFFVVVLLY